MILTLLINAACVFIMWHRWECLDVRFFTTMAKMSFMIASNTLHSQSFYFEFSNVNALMEDKYGDRWFLSILNKPRDLLQLQLSLFTERKLTVPR